MGRFFYIYLFSFFLFLIAEGQLTKKTPFPHSSKKFSLARAYILGDKEKMPYSIKRSHKKLHLQHLMTPSGLHLSAALFFILPFVRRRWKIIIFLTLSTLFFFFPFWPSLRRISLLGLFFQIFPNKKWAVFFIAFFIDYILGGFSQSPWSYSFSFLFLGAIFSIDSLRFPKSQFLLMIFFCQILIAYFFNQYVFPIGLIIGTFITSIFPIVFPFFALDTLFSSIQFMNFFADILEYLEGFSILKFKPNIVQIALVFFILSPKKLLPILFLFSTDINNIPKHLQKRKAFVSSPPSSYLKLKHYSWGTLSFHHNGLKCYNRIYPLNWSTRCKIGIPKATLAKTDPLK